MRGSGGTKILFLIYLHNNYSSGWFVFYYNDIFELIQVTTQCYLIKVYKIKIKNTIIFWIKLVVIIFIL